MPKTFKFHTYEIIYNILLHVAEVFDKCHWLIHLSLTLNPFFSELYFLGRRPNYLKNQFSNLYEIFSSFSLYKAPCNEWISSSNKLLNLKIFKKKLWKFDNFEGMYLIAHCSKKLKAMKNLFCSLHNIISYQTCMKKGSFYLFSNLIYFGQEKATVLICCLVTGYHGHSHHSKSIFLDMLSVQIKISLIKIRN